MTSTILLGPQLIDVNLRAETGWFSQKQIGQLFDRDYTTISKHILNVFKEEELDRRAVVANFATAQIEGVPEILR